MRKIDLLGQKIGFFTVEATVEGGPRRLWLCRCVCGVAKEITTGNLKAGGVRSCGCMRAEASSIKLTRHGHNRSGRRSKEYRTWAHIIDRCGNPDNSSWADYGGRGIFVSPDWIDSFEQFLADMGRSPSPTHSIDRINNDGPYAAGNCRWATRLEQARNTRRTILIDGVCLKDICTDRSLNYDTVQARLKRGAPMEIALSPLTGTAYRRLKHGS